MKRKRIFLTLVMAAFVLLGFVSIIPASAGQVVPWNGQTGMRETFTVLFDGGIFTNIRWVDSSHCPANAGPYNWDNPWEYVREATAEELKNITNPTTCDAATSQGGDSWQDVANNFNIDQNDAAENTDSTDITDPTIEQGIADIFKSNDFELGMFWELFDTYMESNTIQVKGVNGPTSISVKGTRGTLGLWEDNKVEDDTGEYRINYGLWTKNPGTVDKGDWVQVRHKPSVQEPGSFTSTMLIIGEKKGAFRTDGNYESADKRTTDVDPIIIPEKPGKPGQWVESDPFELQGVFPQEIPFVHVAMLSSVGEYRTLIREGDKYTVHSKWTSKKATDVIARLYIQLRVKVPSQPGKKVTAKIKCSDEIGEFTVTSAGFIRAQLAGNSLKEKPYFEYVKAYNVNAPIKFFIDPERFPWIVDKTADIYIVEALDALEADQKADLNAVSNGSKTNFTFGNTREENTFVIAAPNILDPFAFEPDTKSKTGLGHPYDIVIDMDQNGILDDGDFVDGASREAGFYVIHDIIKNGPLKVVKTDCTLDKKILEKFNIPQRKETVYSEETLKKWGMTLEEVKAFFGEYEDEGAEKARLYYPSNIAGMDPRPLIVISHGAGHQYTWYDHIGNYLASYGYIVWAHQNDVAHADRTLVLEFTDALLDIQNEIEGGKLAGKIDSNRIVWVGHSFGAKSAPRAYHNLVTGDYDPKHYTKESIVLISSMLPPGGFVSKGEIPGDVNYHLWVASGDSEVRSDVDDIIGQSCRLYERATGWRMMTTVQGTGHSWFHAGESDSFSAAFVGPFPIGEKMTHKIEKGLFLPLIKHFTERNIPATDFFYRQYERFHPIGVPVQKNPHIVVTHECRENPNKDVFMIDDYEKNYDSKLSSSGGRVDYTVTNLTEGQLHDKDGSFSWDSKDPFNGATQTCIEDDADEAERQAAGEALQGQINRKSNDTKERPRLQCDDIKGSRGVVFDWKGEDFYYKWEVALGKRDFTAYEYISFRGAQITRLPKNLANDGDVTFNLTLIDGFGNESTINIGAYGGGLEHPYRRFIKTGGRQDENEKALENAGWLNEMERIRIRIEDFLTGGKGIDLSNIAAVRLDVGPKSGSKQGRIIIDELMLSK